MCLLHFSRIVFVLPVRRYREQQQSLLPEIAGAQSRESGGGRSADRGVAREDFRHGAVYIVIVFFFQRARNWKTKLLAPLPMMCLKSLVTTSRAHPPTHIISGQEQSPGILPVLYR